MVIVKKIFLVLLIAAGIFNLLNAYYTGLQKFVLRLQKPFFALGYQFIGLETVFKDVRTIGYYTDKNMEDPQAIAQFEQAQYFLAPTVLDLNNTHYRWVILDCTSPKASLLALHTLGLQPLKINKNLILAINPQGIN